MFVFGRLFYVQVIWGEDLQKKAIDQWTREIPVIAARGKITDVNGIVLAGNADTYTVFVRKRAVENTEELCRGLSEILDMDYNYVYSRINGTVSSEITIKKQVTKDKITKLLERGYQGVYYSRDNSRVYPYNDLLAPVMGFTSTDGKGQSGLELYYDKYLSGIDGEILYETDIVGVEIDGGKATYIPATDGLNLKLTIDYEIQSLCETAMEEAMEIHKAKSAQMLVLDPQTGEIRAMCVKPSFNLNDIPRDDLTSLFALGRNGLVCDIYEPGSTFKVLTAAANIEEYLKGNPHAFSPEHIFSSARYRYIDGQKVKCWSTHENGKHAALNLSGALNNSCNPIFVDIAMSLGKETMYDYIEAFNYGTVTGIDFGGEAQGMVLPESAVQNVDLARIAFGQTIAVTGLQLAAATAAAVNGGIYYTPRLVSEIYDGGKSFIASFAETVFKGFERKDKICGEILDRNAGYIGEYLNTAGKILGNKCKVVFSGGINTNYSDIWLNKVFSFCDYEIDAAVAKTPPVYGALCEAFSDSGHSMSSETVQKLKANLTYSLSEC